MATGPASKKLNFSTIQTFHASQSALEAVDKANVLRFLNVKTNGLEAALYTWAAGGFVEGAEILTLPLSAPVKCADNVTRPFMDYLKYLVGETLMEAVMRMNKNLTGIRLGAKPTPTGLALLAFKTTSIASPKVV